jgi:Protein of unknown function (DUF2510)
VFSGRNSYYLNRGLVDWDGYTVFSVIFGVTCILLAGLGKDSSLRSRLWALLGGLFSIGYGFYVAAQDSGIYYFSRAIFILPFALAAKIVYDLVKKEKAPARSEVADPVNKTHEAIKVPSAPESEPASAPQRLAMSELNSAPPPVGRGAEPADGWYQDPLSVRYRLRYWDGRAWTERVD